MPPPKTRCQLDTGPANNGDMAKKNIPLDKAKYAAAKRKAKAKMKVWPSAYGSALLVKYYKASGGRYKKG